MYGITNASKAQSSKITEAQASQIAQSYIISLLASQPKVFNLSAPVAFLPYSVIWDDCTQSVYYTDILAIGNNLSVFRYDYAEGKSYATHIVGQESNSFGPSFILPVSSKCNKYKNLFAVGLNHSTGIIQWDGKSSSVNLLSTLFAVELNDPTSSFGTARQGEKGTLYTGTFHLNYCNAPLNESIYRYTKKKGVEQLVFGSQSTSGIAYDKNSKTLYHVDLCQKQIVGFPLNSNGYIKGKGSIVYNFYDSNSTSSVIPIGLEIDSKGFLYTGNYADGTILRIDPKTSSVATIAQLPSFASIGGLAFGGPKRDILFAVAGSIALNLDSGAISELPPSQTSLYAITNVGKGRKMSSGSVLMALSVSGHFENQCVTKG
ncbi:uncharacterized protein LOC129567015 [Sitodiplosis mosellana]|uniref:uncharacterized protein LOC129567015 n=1 Tax=Sitodiplosis mosellana TaxID=263140 RepID=UPI002443C884|nr:uncharacterized protein LOC129567015 [Sitodiplosis mosellana]